MRHVVTLSCTALIAALAATPVRAEQDLPVPAPRLPNEVLRIPGLPPIELPPGAKVFGPRGPDFGGASPSPAPNATKPSARGEEPASPKREEEQAGDASREKAAPRLSMEAQRGQALDDLFKQLATADSPDDAKGVAAAIQAVWMHSGSDTADLLMTRAVTAVGAGQKDVSLELLDRIVEIAPNWAEAWNKRATVRFLADDYDGAMADIDQTLRLEPRHYGALSGLATILQRSGYDKRALEVLRRVVAIYPQQPDVQKLIDKLAPDIDGRDI